MPKHCAALPGAANELLGSSSAELATALLERLGVSIPAPRDRVSRHAAVLHTPSAYQPRLPAPRFAETALTRADAARAAAGRTAVQAGTALRHRAPALSAMAVTAVGAAAAITATGGFAATVPNVATLPESATSVSAALTLQGTSSATGALPATAPLAMTAPAVADLPTVQVAKVVGDATATAKTLATKERATRATAARRTAAAAAAPATARAAVAAATATRTEAAPKATAGTGVGAAALAAARTKLGKPYSWGASGPNAFDCSGLMLWAFKQAGVTLPRTSAAQSTFGTAVSKANLQPGDLVFFYSPVSHVGMYIGDGKIINATQSGEPVQISNMAYMPFHNARRVTG